jgi:hypothetical protein
MPDTWEPPSLPRCHLQLLKDQTLTPSPTAVMAISTLSLVPASTTSTYLPSHMITNKCGKQLGYAPACFEGLMLWSLPTRQGALPEPAPAPMLLILFRA